MSWVAWRMHPGELGVMQSVLQSRAWYLHMQHHARRRSLLFAASASMGGLFHAHSGVK